MPGVTIGDNVVIGGGSVVIKDIPSGVVAVGNPCKPVKDIPESTYIPPEPEASEPEPTPEPPKKKIRHYSVEEVKK